MSTVNNMAEPSSLYSDHRFSSDIGISSDDDDFVSSASTTSAASDEQSTEKGPLQRESVTESNRNGSDSPLPSTCSVAGPSVAENSFDTSYLAEKTAKISLAPDVRPEDEKKPLLLLDLPIDILQEVVKEVTHTNDLTSLALTCSTLHALAIPQMYSRFDIVWPDTLSSSDHPAGVDALSYGLATLVMGDDIFHELPPSHRPAGSCAHCGCDIPHNQTHAQRETSPLQRIRRGNYYAQYTRKFSVGNGPLIWVQEYSVTKETGKMLGTLVALAIARMINLETFVWDMPTGVLRDVWIALSSLANRPGHDCRLERVWVRWHDNSESPIRSAPTASSFSLPDTQNEPAPNVTGPPLLHKYGHVEYPSLSIVPPLKSLSVLDIDESSYIEEAAILIRRSWDRLRELRIGISSKVCQADWLKPLGGWSSRDTTNTAITGWPKVGGVLGVLLGKADTSCSHEVSRENSEKIPDSETDGSVTSSAPQAETSAPAGSSETPQNEPSPDSVSKAKEPARTPSTSVKPSPSSPSSDVESNHNPLKLDTLELERVSLSIPVILQSLDWTQVMTLTILRCEGHEKLWRSLRRQFPPSCTPRSSKAGKRDGQLEYPLKIKHIHTDSVSPYLLLFIKDTLAPNTLETLFLHEAPMYDSIVQIDAIYRTIIRNHRTSLKKILIDSTERAANGIEIATSRWRKWMFSRDMVSFVTSGRMPRLRELSMTVHSKDWHYFLQRLPNVPRLRALHIPHIAHPVHRDIKELALQILDIVTIRPEVGINYVGMQNKCYEILEGKRGDKAELEDEEDNHSEGIGDSEPWSASDTEDDDGDDAAGAASPGDSTSGLSSHTSSEDESDLDGSRSRVTFRLREILFYDDKIAIFKARHGVL